MKLLNRSGVRCACLLFFLLVVLVSSPVTGIDVSTGVDGDDPHAAFSETEQRWLVVWVERPQISVFDSIFARFVASTGAPVGSAFTVAVGQRVSPPRVAYHPRLAQWLVVWTEAGGGGVDATGAAVRGKFFPPPQGQPLGDVVIAIGSNTLGARVDVVASQRTFFVQGIPPEIYFVVAWDEMVSGRRAILARELHPAPGPPYRVDTGGALPAGHQSFAPRFSRSAPVELVLKNFAPFTFQPSHFVTFAVENNGQRDIFVGQARDPGSRAAVRLTDTANIDEFGAVVDWNSTSGQAIVAYGRPGDEVIGRYVRALSSGGDLGPEFLIGTGRLGTVEGHPLDSTFVVVGGATFNRVAGMRSSSDPLGIGIDSVASFAFTSTGRALQVWRNSVRAFQTIDAELLPLVAPLANAAPTADAGIDFEVVEGTVFELDATSSSDPDDDPLDYRWTQSGDEDFFVTAAERSSSRPRLLAPALGADGQSRIIAFDLAVDDLRSEDAFTAADTISVTIVASEDENPPSASAGPDQTVAEGSLVTLAGSASDPDGESIALLWRLLRTDPDIGIDLGSVVLSDSVLASPTFTAPRFASAGGVDLVFQLLATSSRGGQGSDEITVHVDDTINEVPIADAGAAFTVNEGQLFALDGTGSRDPNGDALSFEWEVIGPLFFDRSVRETAVITPGTETSPSAAAVATVFQEHEIEFRLTVDDGRGGVVSDTVMVNVAALPLNITSVGPDVGSPGSLITIEGTNLFNQTGGLEVFFGERTLARRMQVARHTDSELVVIVPSGVGFEENFVRRRRIGRLARTDFFAVRSGPVILVRDGVESIIVPDFEVVHHRIFDFIVTQGLFDVSFVRRKDTLVQVRVRSAEETTGYLPEISGAVCTVTGDDGSFFRVEVESDTPSTVLPNVPSAPLVVTSMSEAINVFIPGSLLTAERYTFDVILLHNDRSVGRIRSIDFSEPFVDMPSPRFLIVPVVPLGPDGFNDSSFIAPLLSRAESAVDTFRRVFPFPETTFSSSIAVEGMLGEFTDDAGLIGLQAFDVLNIVRDVAVFNRMADRLSSWNTLVPDEQADFVIAFIDKSLRSPTSQATGLAVGSVELMADLIRYYIEIFPGKINEFLGTVVNLVFDITCVSTGGLLCSNTVDDIVGAALGALQINGTDVSSRVSFVFANSTAGSTLAQEIGHNLGYVNPFANNSDADNLSHSRFDEDEAGLTFFDTIAADQVFNVTAPGQIFTRGGNLAKSVMSYAPGSTDSNVFLEPTEYQALIRSRQSFDFKFGDEGGELDGDGGGLPGPNDRPKVKIVGHVELVGLTAEVLEMRPLPIETLETRPREGSPIACVFLDDNDLELFAAAIDFTLFVPIQTHPDDDGQSPELPEIDDVAALFSVVLALPVGTTAIEIRVDGEPLWRREASESDPTVTWIVPSGGESIGVGKTLTLRWSADDADAEDNDDGDGDGVLSHSVYYSNDDGATFRPVALGLAGTSHALSADALAGGDACRLKVVSSDGFRSGEAISGRFAVADAAVVPTILSPAPGSEWLNSRSLALRARMTDPARGSVTEGGTYSWSSSIDGDLGVGQDLFLPAGLTPGVHEIKLRVSAVTSAETSVSIRVLADSDGDGLSDELENAHPALDPDNAQDALGDPDRDGLTTLGEVLEIGSDPLVSDTDGDGVLDGEEVRAGQSALKDDTDGDGVPDGIDNCPVGINPDQADVNEDGIGDVCPVAWQISFIAGLNLIELPVGIDEGLDSALAAITFLGGSERVQSISRWDEEAQSFRVLELSDGGEVIGDDFSITSGDGLQVIARVAFDIAFAAPLACSARSVSPERRLVGLGCEPDGTSAFEFLLSIGSDQAEIERLVSGSATLESARLQDGTPVGIDFPIRRGEGYWVTGETSGDANFRRGDANASEVIDISDGVFVLNWLFTGGADPGCQDAADVDDDGRVNISDAIALFNYLFLGGTTPPAPGPEICGDDPSVDDLAACEGGC